MNVLQPLRDLSRELDAYAKAFAAVALAALIVQWAFIVLFLWPRLGTLDYLRLHYTAARGVDWVGEWWLILVFPAIGLVCWFMNLAFAAKFARPAPLLARCLLGVTALIELSLAAGGIFAVLLNA